MVEILAIIGSIIGIVASIIQILDFFKILKPKYKVAIFIVIAVATTTCFICWQKIDSNRENQRIENLKQNFLKEDAKQTVDGIIISGWENSGDYIGYLTQIVGFYGRHKDLYKFEYETNRKQLDSFLDYFKDKRQKNESTYTSEWEQLKGLVTSGRDNLRKISGIQK